MIDQGE